MKNATRFPAFVLFTGMVGLLAIVASGETIQVPADHQTIQAAIDVAKLGDVVLVASGTYRERLRMKSGVSLRSAGDDAKGMVGLRRAESTIIDGAGDHIDGPGIAMAENSVVDGFTVTGVGGYDEAKWDHHHATQGNEQSHQHIGRFGTAGIEVDGVNCAVRNNVVHHIGDTGIAVHGRCSPHIDRNVCYRNMGGGIGSMAGSTALIEENVCFENFYAGIGHDDASPTVINNVCYRNIRAGIGISHGACPVVRGNKCYENRRAGIGIRTGSDTRPVVEENDCYENQMAGIGTEEEASPLIRGNRCYKNKLAGIGSRSRATPTIIGNECYENEKVGIGQQGDCTTLLIDNDCHHNKTAGIGFDPCKAGRCRVVNNRVIDNERVAVGIHSGWTVDLTGNELSRRGGMPPIVMIFQGASAKVVGNTIEGSGVAAIRVAGTATIVQNNLKGESMRPAGPPNFAVWALPGSSVAMFDNKVENWRHGLHATGASITAHRNTIENFHREAIVIKDAKEPASVLGNIVPSGDLP